jgi:hypothetical protein
MDGPPPLYRLHLRTAGDHSGVVRFCLDSGRLAMGWGPTRWLGTRTPKDWEDYLALSADEWSRRQLSSVYALRNAPEGSLVWTRDTEGVYYLSQLTGEWEYIDTERARELDVNNSRPAHIVEVGAEAEVPGAVVRRFSRQGSTLQRVHDRGAAMYSAWLFAQAVGGSRPGWAPSLQEILDSLLGPFDVQDLVAAYLQVERGYIALPARQTDNTIAYEYVLRHPDDGHLAAVQVKTGDADIDLSTLSNTGDLRWFVFSSRERYRGEMPSFAEAIAPEAIVAFLRDRSNALPPVAERWTRLARDA